MKTIVWDIDDVLNNLMEAWLENRCRKTQTTVAYKDIIENPPHNVLKITKEDYLKDLDRFRNSKEGENLKPNPVILEWFKHHGTEFRHMALTARPKHTVAKVSAWVFQHFGDWIRTVSFVPSLREGDPPPIYDKNKKEFLQWFGRADYFIDDSPENIEAVKSLAIKTFLYPQPWNTGDIPLGVLLNQLVMEARSR